jgi:hypothetical protein
VYTSFFDTCWTEADGMKADVADIAIRMMRTGDKPRHTGDWQVATAKSQEAILPLGATHAQTPDQLIQRAIDEWKLVHPNDDPFLPEDEMADPRLRWMRETLRQRYNFNKSRQ